jgi:hypothetical protein
MIESKEGGVDDTVEEDEYVFLILQDATCPAVLASTWLQAPIELADG